MSTISLCMIVRNEEAVLERCLRSASSIADEIIIIDTGSTDRTKEIALGFTPKVFSFPWRDDFSAARNESFSKASMDYCMWLDADDVIPSGSLDSWLSLKRQLDRTSPPADVVMAPYHAAFDQNDSPAFTYYRERLLRREGNFRWTGRVHEAIAPSGEILYTSAAVEHRKEKPGDPDRNLRIYREQLAQGESLEPRQQFYYARELLDHGEYAEAQKVLSQFLKEGKGWVENNLDACRLLGRCLLAQGKEDESLQALLWALSYAPPRAELCCDLGEHFFNRQRWKEAAFWYSRALEAERKEGAGAFMIEDCYEYLPCIQLCVCCYHLGNQIKAEEYNERAGKIKPDSEAFLYNRSFFAGLHTGNE